MFKLIYLTENKLPYKPEYFINKSIINNPDYQLTREEKNILFNEVDNVETVNLLKEIKDCLSQEEKIKRTMCVEAYVHKYIGPNDLYVVISDEKFNIDNLNICDTKGNLI